MKQSNNKKSRDVTAFLYERLSRDDNLEGESYSIGNHVVISPHSPYLDLCSISIIYPYYHIQEYQATAIFAVLRELNM